MSGERPWVEQKNGLGRFQLAGLQRPLKLYRVVPRETNRRRRFAIGPKSAVLTLPSRFSLTSFERYQYWETQPGHPNQITAIFDFDGPLDANLLVRAATMVRQRHPLLMAQLLTHVERPVSWVVGGPDRLPIVVREVSDWQRDQLPSLEQVNPTTERAGCLTVLHNQRKSQWILQTHHAACDGVGGLQVIRELVQAYHELSHGRTPSFRPLPPERLLERNSWKRDWAQWWKAPLQLLGLFGATKFLLRHPVEMEADPLKLAEFEPPTGTECLEYQLTASQTRRIRDWARQAGVTVNSLILAYWMIALDQWIAKSRSLRDDSIYRLVIPTNERQGRDINLSACNRVSLVYVDRRRRELREPDALMHGIQYEMGVMRRLGLTRTMLLALRIMGWIPGILKRHARTPKCWATSYVTNLGAALNRLNVDRDSEGRSIAGGLTLERVRLLPPLRPGTPLAMAVHQYSGRLSFSLHYQVAAIPPAEAQRILGYFLNRLRTLS